MPDPSDARRFTLELAEEMAFTEPWTITHSQWPPSATVEFDSGARLQVIDDDRWRSPQSGRWTVRGHPGQHQRRVMREGWPPAITVTKSTPLPLAARDVHARLWTDFAVAHAAATEVLTARRAAADAWENAARKIAVLLDGRTEDSGRDTAVVGPATVQPRWGGDALFRVPVPRDRAVDFATVVGDFFAGAAPSEPARPASGQA